MVISGSNCRNSLWSAPRIGLKRIERPPCSGYPLPGSAVGSFEHDGARRWGKREQQCVGNGATGPG